jgi:predicted glycoside hydrolase/deacetylase ChbG (UPF0249 family)
MTGQAIKLIVNADDYGYYPCVSRGILEAAATGRVTATAILANGPQLDRQIAGLSGYDRLDLGVHLNLTSRHPLTVALAEKLNKWNGQFPGAFAMTGEIISGRIGLDTIRKEWCTQIETIRGFGIKPQFLNSHEHIHMLPKLFALAGELAAEYQIPYLRLSDADWLPPFGFSSLLRNVLIKAMASLNSRRISTRSPLFIGLSRSGKLDLAYLQRCFAKFKPGGVYELMCHPGHFDATEITDARLLSYHAWESELALLTGTEFKALCEEYNIKLTNYTAMHS